MIVITTSNSMRVKPRPVPAGGLRIASPFEEYRYRCPDFNAYPLRVKGPRGTGDFYDQVDFAGIPGGKPVILHAAGLHTSPKRRARMRNIAPRLRFGLV